MISLKHMIYFSSNVVFSPSNKAVILFLIKTKYMQETQIDG
jgi:hypothetical protein